MVAIEASTIGAAARPAFAGRSAELRDVAALIDQAGEGNGAIVPPAGGKAARR